MADVTVVRTREVTPAGQELNDYCHKAMVDGTYDAKVVVGDLVRLESDGWHLLPTDDTEPDGVVLIDTFAGDKAPSIGRMPEIEGYSGLTLGGLIYPSGDNAGKVSHTAVGKACGKAVSATKIRFFVQ